MTNPIIKINVKGLGAMTAELYPEKAPLTVANFVKLAKSGFYEGLIFHRVISGFMIQGGGYTEDMQDKDCDSIRGEFRANGFPQNDIKHVRGVLSMARTSAPNSASSQFFVMHENSPHLDGQYAAFGKLTDGFDVLDAIADTETGNYGWYMQDVPTTPIVIESVEVIAE